MLKESQKYNNNKYSYRVKRHCSNKVLDSIENAVFREQPPPPQKKACGN